MFTLKCSKAGLYYVYVQSLHSWIMNHAINDYITKSEAWIGYKFHVIFICNHAPTTCYGFRPHCNASIQSPCKYTSSAANREVLGYGPGPNKTLPTFLRAKAAMLSVRLSHRNSVRLSVTRVDQAKTVQARISKSSPSAAWKTLVSGTVKVFHKFEGSHPEWGR